MSVIVVGGGLSGLSAAHTVLERGGRVLVLDKSAFLQLHQGHLGHKWRTDQHAGQDHTVYLPCAEGDLAVRRYDSREHPCIAPPPPLQVKNGIKDSRETFYEDTAKSAGVSCRPPLVKTLTYGSAPAVEWLQEAFGIDLARSDGRSLGASHAPRQGEVPRRHHDGPDGGVRPLGRDAAGSREADLQGACDRTGA